MELEPISQVRVSAFKVINDFLRGDFTSLGDGRTQMFILSDAGMGKTSLLMMIRLMHRGRDEPDVRNDVIGFRCARVQV